MTADVTRQLLYRIISSEQQKRLEIERQLDLSYSIPGLARFRVNIYSQRESLAGAFRLIPAELKSLEELGLPSTLYELCNKPRGLVLVTGPTGSGKSTTLAALIDEINRTRADHIITIEDPIEFLHRHKRCIVNQRELGPDATTFAEALRGALRQDPDVILLGEMRDLETISTALTAAETGHLVFATLHTQDAASTVDRVIDVFPAGAAGPDPHAARRHARRRRRADAAPDRRRPGPRRRDRDPPPGRRRPEPVRQAKIEQVYSIMQTGRQEGHADDGAGPRRARPARRDHRGDRPRALEPAREAARPARTRGQRGRPATAASPHLYGSRGADDGPEEGDQAVRPAPEARQEGARRRGAGRRAASPSRAEGEAELSLARKPKAEGRKASRRPQGAEGAARQEAEDRGGEAPRPAQEARRAQDRRLPARRGARRQQRHGRARPGRPAPRSTRASSSAASCASRMRSPTALKTFFRENKLPRQGVRLGIASNRIGVRMFELAGIDDPKQLENAIRFRAQEALPIPLEEAVLDYQLLGETRRRRGPERSTASCSSSPTATSSSATSTACKKAGIRLAGVDLEAFALLRALGERSRPRRQRRDRRRLASAATARRSPSRTARSASSRASSSGAG